MINANYWIWLQNCFRPGTRISDIIKYFGSVVNLYNASENELRESGLFAYSLFEPHPQKIRELKNTPLSIDEEIIHYCSENNIGIITPDDEEYPDSLKQQQDFPAVLYYRGDISCLKEEKMFAVIGTRNPSDYGNSACKQITAELVRNGSTIISGGALGIDSTAHSTTIKNGGKTILVMGAGLDSGYLRSNNELRKQVEENGVVISEYAPKTSATQYTFPLRNRIVASLSRGVIVVEAGERSGTLNTCGEARKRFTPIFVLPGDLNSPLYAGSRRLTSEGAMIAYSGADILRYFDYSVLPSNDDIVESSTEPFEGISSFTDEDVKKRGTPRSQRKRKTKSKPTVKVDSETVETEIPTVEKKEVKALSGDFSDYAIKLYESIKSGNITFDDMVNDTQIPPFMVMRALTELEMEGIIEKLNSVEYNIK